MLEGQKRKHDIVELCCVVQFAEPHNALDESNLLFVLSLIA